MPRPSDAPVRAIRTEADHRAALAEVETLMHAAAGTPEGDRLDILVTLIEAWEARHEPVPPPDPIEAILFMMAQKGLTRRDLARPSGTADGWRRCLIGSARLLCR